MIFTDINQVKEVIQKAIMFYNYERPHMSLEMRTPVEVATETGRFKRRWISYRERAIDSMNENLRIIKKRLMMQVEKFFVTSPRVKTRMVNQSQA